MTSRQQLNVALGLLSASTAPALTARLLPSVAVTASGTAGCAIQVFADLRYQRHDKRDKLPGWITSHLKDAHLNLSTDMLMHVAREFMRSMAQPYHRMQVGKSLLTEEQANAMDVSRL